MYRLPCISLAVLTAAALAYELLLMRLFSIIQWHHFAYMVIGLALLGHGFSGSLVMIWQERLLKNFRPVYIACIGLFSVFAIVSFQAAQLLPFNAEELLWNWRQIIYLLTVFLLLSVPFFFVGSAICLTFLYFKQHVARLYAADLLGAGTGCIGVVFLLYLVFPQSALLCVSVAGLVAAAIAGFELNLRKTYQAGIVTGLILLLVWTGGSVSLHMSPFKSLQKMLLIKGTRVIAEKSSPLGLITILASDKVPLRYAPGMSLSSGSEPLPQLGVFIDGDNMNVITAKENRRQELAYLDQMTSALPYHLQPINKALILGSGTGSDILQAQYHQVGHVDAIELNKQLIEATDSRYGNFISDVYRRPGVQEYVVDGRDFLTSHSQKNQLIQLSLLDSFNAATAGLYALNESYLYTVEALELYLSRLQPDGYLSITRWLKMPPRDILKLFNTALSLLQSSNSVSHQMLMIRSWQTATLIIKNGTFTVDEIAATELFCEQRNFDLVYTPKIKAGQVNRFNLLKDPVLYNATQALLSEKDQQFIDRYKFNIEPATDDKPYFDHFFRWSSFPEIVKLLDKGGASLIETGYLVIFLTLFIAILTSLLLILGPLIFLRRGKIPQQNRIKHVYVLGYFFSIGMGFLMMEIAFMQKFTLFLHRPVFSAAAILAAFLIFAGAGSACSGYFRSRYGRQDAVWLISFLIALLSVITLWILPIVFNWGSQLSMPTKFVLSIGLIAPLAFFMGMPMPLALSSLSDHAENLIPWAWGINGCASVISSVLSAILAMQFGFSSLIVIAAVLYFVALFLYPRPEFKYPNKNPSTKAING